MNAAANTYWQRHPGLVWSNPAADDSVHIQAALLKPRFSRLLDIAVEFGLERVQREWTELNQDGSREAVRAGTAVGRILNHIQKGFALASFRN